MLSSTKAEPLCVGRRRSTVEGGSRISVRSPAPNPSPPSLNPLLIVTPARRTLAQGRLAASGAEKPLDKAPK